MLQNNWQLKDRMFLITNCLVGLVKLVYIWLSLFAFIYQVRVQDRHFTPWFDTFCTKDEILWYPVLQTSELSLDCP